MLTKATYHPSTKTYELTNHLGNVMRTISDRKVPVDDASNNILYFLPDVDTDQDYFPFGMVMSERSGSENSAGYRYGFGGQEQDNELYGHGNSYTAEFWQYDTRLGRRWNVDPLTAKYPWQSSYCAFNNNPIFYSDPSGKSGVAYMTKEKNEDGKTIIKVVSNYYIYGEHASPDLAEAMEVEAMDQWNNCGEFFTVTIDGEEYEVQFEISVQKIEESEIRDIMLEGGDYFNLNRENNFYEIVDELPKDWSGVSFSRVSQRGKETGGNAGALLAGLAFGTTFSHEMNHGFAGENKDTKTRQVTSDNDIAVQAWNSLSSEDRKVTQDNVQYIFDKLTFKDGKADIGDARPSIYDESNPPNYSQQIPR